MQSESEFEGYMLNADIEAMERGQTRSVVLLMDEALRKSIENSTKRVRIKVIYNEDDTRESLSEASPLWPSD